MPIIMQNSNNKEYEALLNDLIIDVFGFSFAPWHELALWDERYESYAIISNGLMLANICIFKTELLLNGKKVNAHQYGAVATRKGYRGQGLSRKLMGHIEAKYPHMPAFLFANPSVIDYYPRFGFQRIRESRQMISKHINNSIPAVRLDSADARVKNAIRRRGAFSRILDCANTLSVQMFHMLMEYEQGIYDIKDCGAIVVAEQQDELLFIADVVCERPLDFDILSDYLPFAGVERVEFGFCADWLDVQDGWQPFEGDDNPMFIRGDIPLPHAFRFPMMSAT